MQVDTKVNYSKEVAAVGIKTGSKMILSKKLKVRSGGSCTFFDRRRDIEKVRKYFLKIRYWSVSEPILVMFDWLVVDWQLIENRVFSVVCHIVHSWILPQNHTFYLSGCQSVINHTIMTKIGSVTEQYLISKKYFLTFSISCHLSKKCIGPPKANRHFWEVCHALCQLPLPFL